MQDPGIDLWAADEVHFQQHGSRCRMWIPPEVKDPVLLHAPTRKSVGYFGAVRLRDGQLVFRRETGQFNGASFFQFLQQLRRVSRAAGRRVAVTLELQSQISHDLADRMHQVEDDDMFRFGKTRIAWENWLNPEKPALHTEPPPKEAVKPVVASGERNGNENGHRPMAPPSDPPSPRTRVI